MAQTGKYAVPPARGWGLYYDPLYGYLPLPPCIRRALDLPSLQRLRWVKQLSTVELVFPGATHSRLEHSVGVYHLATAAFDSLFTRRESERKYRDEWPPLGPAYKLALQMGALFHDVGHGPWSHAFESSCKRNPDWGFMRHDHQSKRVILGDAGHGDIPEYLRKLSSKLQAQGIPDHEMVLPANVGAIAVGEPPPSKPQYLFLSQIVCSEFDVDRMDYLQRDASHTGVGVGTVDVWEIIHNLLIAKEDGTVKGETIWGARISSRAAEAFEALLTVRDLAYRKVYYHKTHRAAQEMLVRAMEDMGAVLSKEDLSSMTDNELLERMIKDGTPFARDVAQRIRQRRLYEPLPIDLNPFNHLDEAAKSRVFRLAAPPSFAEHQSFLKKQDEISRTVMLPAEQKILFDIETTPISKRDAYRLAFFYDDVRGISLSLLDLCPHLELTHGEISLGTTKVDLYQRYLESVTKLLILVPVELLEKCVELAEEGQRKRQQKESSLLPDPKIFDEVLETSYDQYIAPVMKGFLDSLSLQNTDRRKSLNEDLKSRTLHLLRRMHDET